MIIIQQCNKCIIDLWIYKLFKTHLFFDAKYACFDYYFNLSTTE